MRFSDKVGLACLFCVALVTIALDILRMYESIGAGGVFAYSALYCTLETTVATMIACAPTFRGVFGMRRQGRSGSYEDMGAPSKADGHVELVRRATSAASAESAAPSSSHSDSKAMLAESRLFGKYDSKTMPTTREYYEDPESSWIASKETSIA